MIDRLEELKKIVRSHIFYDEVPIGLAEVLTALGEVINYVGEESRFKLTVTNTYLSYPYGDNHFSWALNVPLEQQADETINCLLNIFKGN